MRQATFNNTGIPMPDLEIVPEHHREDVFSLFSVWSGVRERNASLSRYFDMKNDIKNLGISIPPQLTNTNCVVGWCEKAVHARVVRSKFDGYVSRGGKNAELDALTLENDMRALYKQAATCALTHGLAAMTVMKGGAGQPVVKVRVLSANQFACLWDKSLDRIKCGIALHDVDDTNTASAYVAYFDDCVITFRRGTPAKSWEWTANVEPNPMGRPLMEVLVNAPHPDHPLGRSLLTPELRGIVDKAMRDVLRMEIGAEFFTFPQRYILGAADDLFAPPLDPDQPVDEDGDPIDEEGNKLPRESSDLMKLKAYVGAYMALTRDENGDLPQVGQFSAAPAENIHVFTVDFGELARADLTYQQSDSGLIGVAHAPAYDHVSTETNVLTGMLLFPEVKDYIIKGTINPAAA